MDPVIEYFISLIDRNGLHCWIPGKLSIFSLFCLRFRIQSNFIESREGRMTFLSALERFRMEAEQLHTKYGRCVMRLWKPEEDNDGEWRCYAITAYGWDAAKPFLYYLGKCKMAQLATERALRKQGRIHKDVISIVAQYVWASRWREEWIEVDFFSKIPPEIILYQEALFQNRVW